MLTSDLDSEEEKDRAALDALLTALLTELNMQNKVWIHVVYIEQGVVLLFQGVQAGPISI